MLTQARLRELFDYQDGILVRKRTGKVVVCSENKTQPYLRVYVDGKPHRLHRLIFLHQHGYLPKVVDHIDGNCLNNRVENLREVTQQQNCLNRKHHKNSSSPYKNVYWNTNAKKWAVVLSVKQQRKYFGVFDDIELADLVATEARDLHHGLYARHF